MIAYNYSNLVIEDKKADSIAIKGISSAVKLYNLVDGKVQINTADYTVGNYLIQFFKADEVIREQQLQIKQNLKYASADYDIRSNNQKILQAIEAVLAGRATAGQYKVKVGEKQLEYSTFQQLIQYKDYYSMLVAKQQGKPCVLRHEKIYYRSI